MNILLIGNFAPPYEEESLHNISLFHKLTEDGHNCTVINISPHPAEDRGFINASSNITYFSTLLKRGMHKDVIHFLTKGYLRVGLLKMMLSIFVGTVMRARKIVTFHSEFFSVLGQMRSPFGGTQTLYTSFALADTVIFTDRESMDASVMYKKKDNFELVPSFLYLSKSTGQPSLPAHDLLSSLRSVAFFGNVQQPSFILEVLTDLIERESLPDDAGIVVSFSSAPSEDLQHRLREHAGPIRERLLFIAGNDRASCLSAFSKASLIVSPMTCDGETFFQEIAVTLKRPSRAGDFLFIPETLVLVKAGRAAQFVSSMVSRSFAVEPTADPGDSQESAYQKLLSLYSGK